MHTLIVVIHIFKIQGYMYACMSTDKCDKITGMMMIKFVQES